MKSIFDGFLTRKCEACPFWAYGSDERGYGCAVPFPIDACPYFKNECMEAEKDSDKF